MISSYPHFEIETQDADEKGRSFRAALIAYLSWSGFRTGKRGTPTPLLAAVAGTEGELRPFVANLRSGATALRASEDTGPYQLCLGERPVHRCFVQRIGPDLVATHFVPNLFSLDPPPGTPCQFVLAPPTRWIARETERLAASGTEHPRQLALARYFVAFVDRRTEFPIPPYPELHRALYQAFARQDLLHDESHRDVTAFGFSALGYEEPIVVDAPKDQLETILRELISTHLPKDTYDGATRLSAGGWVLSDPSHALAGAGLRF